MLLSFCTRNLADVGKDGKLDIIEFRIAMHLVYACIEGGAKVLPSQLPGILLESANTPIGKKLRESSEVRNITRRPSAISVSMDLETMTNAASLSLMPNVSNNANNMNLKTSASGEEEISHNFDSLFNPHQICAEKKTDEDQQARSEASRIMKSVFILLEEGQFASGLSKVKRAIEMLCKKIETLILHSTFHNSKKQNLT